MLKDDSSDEVTLDMNCGKLSNMKLHIENSVIKITRVFSSTHSLTFFDFSFVVTFL